VRDKVAEELVETDEAVRDAAAGDSEHVKEELGDLLFALANWSRHLGVDAEEALRGANGKFEGRFRIMETLAQAQGRALESFSAAEWEELWAQAKQREPGPRR
jgi:uncharacterized protein YabN with tetrapyrrole methylase and pyrophosphatase domain